MAAKDAILGVLIEQPSCAYELGLRVEQRLGPVRLTARNVYGALQTLEREGLAEPIDGESATPGPWSRKKYRATEAGIEHFAEWMHTATDMEPERDELRLKILLSRPHHCARLAELVYGQEILCRAELEAVAASDEPKRPHADESPRTWQGDLEAVGRATEAGYWQSRIAWLQSVREALAAVQAHPS